MEILVFCLLFVGISNHQTNDQTERPNQFTAAIVFNFLCKSPSWNKYESCSLHFKGNNELQNFIHYPRPDVIEHFVPKNFLAQRTCAGALIALENVVCYQSTKS